MPIRLPIVAGMFYPANEAACRQQVQEYLARHATFPPVEGARWGGIVPHAGWAFSGGVAARTFAALAAAEEPETVVLFGAVHSWGVSEASLYGSGTWRTPLGDVAIDAELAQQVLQTSRGLIAERPAAHAEEHSIEVQLPFVQALWPKARILPIAMPPMAMAPEVGRAVAQAVRAANRRAVGIGSSDLTHYGPRYRLAPVGVGERGLEWTHRNDQHLLDLVAALRATEIVAEAEARHNACGPGAIAAAIAYAVELGATHGSTLEYTTSYEVLPMGRPTDLVGYAAIAFC
jgi:MEMO1 family protein